MSDVAMGVSVLVFSLLSSAHIPWPIRALKASLALHTDVPRSRNQVYRSRRGRRSALVRAFVAMMIASAVPTFASAQCPEATAASCRPVALDCRTSCERSYHREEALHACFQECQANYVACTAAARCGEKPTPNIPPHSNTN